MRKRQALLLLAVLVCILAVAGVLVVLTAWRSIPRQNTAQTHFDAILVLGTPCTRAGEPTPEQRQRTLEGVSLWRAGVAPRLILSGAAAHNQFAEADCMAKTAEAAGVPAADIFEERQALDTVQNIYYADAILRAHGWNSVDVVSSYHHLPRASLILAHYPALYWRTDAAPWPASYTFAGKAFRDWTEAVYCLNLRMHGFHASRFITRWPPGRRADKPRVEPKAISFAQEFSEPGKPARAPAAMHPGHWTMPAYSTA